MPETNKHTISPSDEVLPETNKPILSPSDKVLPETNKPIISPSDEILPETNKHIISPSDEVLPETNKHIISPSNEVLPETNKPILSPSNEVLPETNKYINSPSDEVLSETNKLIISPSNEVLPETNKTILSPTDHIKLQTDKPIKSSSDQVVPLTNILPTDISVPQTNKPNISVNDSVEPQTNQPNTTSAESEESTITFIEKYILFRQLNKFNYDEANRKINFNFYGLTSKNMKKDDIIKMKVNLIENKITSEELIEAVCYLSEDVVIENEIKQANFNCNIENLKDDLEYYSFSLKSSDYILGIPDNYILLNPLFTEAAISKGYLPDYSDKNTANKIKSIFNSNSIDSSDCSTFGKFKINGTFKSELESDLNFILSFNRHESATATCSLKKGKKDSNQVIECLVDSEINDKIIIEHGVVFDEQNLEIIVIGGIESNEKIKCSNGKLMAANNKVNLNLVFRQVSHFSSKRGKTSFVLNTISPLSVPSRNVKLKAYLIDKKGIKDEKEITCSFKSIYSIYNEKIYQINFDCSVDGICEDIEIISSEDITGINNDLEQIQKSPKKTDEEIKKTEKDNDLIVGKLYNFNLPEYINIFPPTLEIEKVESDLCIYHGILILRGRFNKDLQKDYDFDLSLSYPSSTIKCTAPRTNKNKTVSIVCIAQKEFIKSSHFIIEQIMIKKKYKEILFIKSLKSTKTITCSNFNKLNEKKIQKRKKSKFTFLQICNYKKAQKPTFNLFIHSLGKFVEKNLRITIFINRNLRLRNLEETETEAECTLNKQNDSSGNVKLDCITISDVD